MDAQVAVAQVTVLSGKVKWFDQKKGYGFIVPDDGGPDILLHVSVLREAGHQAAYEGTVVSCSVVSDQEGKCRAVQIHSLDNSAVVGVPSRVVRNPYVPNEVAGVTGPQMVIVTWFDPAKGFGFVRLSGYPKDVFLHRAVLRAAGMHIPGPGDQLTVYWGQSSKGPTVVEVVGS